MFMLKIVFISNLLIQLSSLLTYWQQFHYSYLLLEGLTL